MIVSAPIDSDAAMRNCLSFAGNLVRPAPGRSRRCDGPAPAARRGAPAYAPQAALRRSVRRISRCSRRWRRWGLCRNARAAVARWHGSELSSARPGARPGARAGRCAKTSAKSVSQALVLIYGREESENLAQRDPAAAPLRPARTPPGRADESSDPCHRATAARAVTASPANASAAGISISGVRCGAMPPCGIPFLTSWKRRHRRPAADRGALRCQRVRWRRCPTFSCC